MSSSEVTTNEVSKKRQIEDVEIESQKKVKTVKETIDQVDVPTLKLNPLLEDSKLLEKLKSSWGKEDFESKDCPSISFGKLPFPYGEINDIVVDPSSLFQTLQKSLKYDEKVSDLFHFRQSCDLSTMSSSLDGYESVKAICNLFQTKIYETLKVVTGLPLNGTFDAFASQYQIKDHLLCHDDELDSRRIAFILYMNEEWKENYGGTLDLYDSTETDDGIQPGKIVKSIVPAFNKLAFFEVSAKSFHQVAEVLTNSVSRFAISGWFYGDPLPRPAIQLPEDVFKNVDFPEREDGCLEENLDTSYLDQNTLTTVNQKLTENSEILLSNFLKPELYSSILNLLENIKDSQWEKVGPANLRNFQQLTETNSEFPRDSLAFFKTKSFLEFLQGISEFPFASEPDLQVTCSLQKFQEGSYTLIRGKERHYGKPDEEKADLGLNNEDDESESEIEDGIEDLCEQQVTKKIENHVNGNGPKENGESSHDLHEKHEKNNASAEQNGIAAEKTAESSENVLNLETRDNNEEVEDEEDEDAIAEEDEEDEEMYEMVEDSEAEEETSEPNRIDVMFFVIPPPKENISEKQNGNSNSSTENDKTVEENTTSSSKSSSLWDENFGGNKIYTDDLTGKQLINIIPKENSLGIVVRDESISSHYSYINKAFTKGRKFYCLNFEFKFPSQMSV